MSRYETVTAFLDLSLLTESNKQRIYSLMRKYKIKNIYVGIDEVSENRLGVCRGGKLLSREQIETQLERLKNLKEELSRIGIAVGITANTILSPFEDRAEFEKKFYVIEQL